MMKEEFEKFRKKVSTNNEEILAEVAAKQAARKSIPVEERQHREKLEKESGFFGKFRSAEGKKLVPSFVVFADLLGVRQRIEKSDDDAELLHIMSAAIEAAAPMLEGGVWSYFRYYSDCVSLITPTIFEDDDSHESEFGEIITSLGRWQAKMVWLGFPVRGGLAFGSLYVDERSLFGKAHLAAYNLESKIAVYPRICLCPETIKLLHKQMSAYATSYESPQERDVIVDIDDQVFVNYLSAFQDQFEGREIELIDRHRDFIQNELNSCSDSVRDKYLWMRDYHNWVCDDWSNRYGDFSASKLGESERQFRNLRQWLNGDAK